MYIHTISSILSSKSLLCFVKEVNLTKLAVSLTRDKCSSVGELVNCKVKLAKQERRRQNTEGAGHVASHFLSHRCFPLAFLPLPPYVRPRRRKRPLFSTWHHSEVAHTGTNSVFPSRWHAAAALSTNWVSSACAEKIKGTLCRKLPTLTGAELGKHTCSQKKNVQKKDSWWKVSAWTKGLLRQ